MKNFFKFFFKIYRKYRNYRYLKKHFPNIKFDKNWYENILLNTPIYLCKLERIKLKYIKCLILIDGKWVPSPINQSPDYKYLISGERQVYIKYHEYYNETQKEKHNHSCENFEMLVNSLKEVGYDSTNPICVNKNNEIIDGQHRASYLLKEFGEDYEITVFKIYY